MSTGNIANYQGAALSANTEVIRENGCVYRKVYNDTGSALSNGAIYRLSFEVDATDTANPVLRHLVKAPATEATESNVVCVVDNSRLGLSTIADKAYGFVCVEGPVKAQVDGTSADVAVGDQLEVLNAGTAFIQAASATTGDSGALVPEAAAIALEARATNSAGLQWVHMIGRPCQIKGS